MRRGNNENQLPLPLSTTEGLKWKEACIPTRSNERYKHLYNFKRYQQKDNENGQNMDWIQDRPYGNWCKDYPQSIAIDCEMCETKDPITGATDGKALCRVSIINASKPKEILLDSLVNPQWPIIDDRFLIHGIRGSSLDNVKFTLLHSQDFLKSRRLTDVV